MAGAASLASRVTTALSACAADRVTPEIALVRLLAIAPDLEVLSSALRETQAEPELCGSLLRLIEAEPEGVRATAEILQIEAQSADLGFGGDPGAAVARAFDRAVMRSEEASVASYSLGSADRLEAATREVVLLLVDLGVIRHDGEILQIGCGIGRFEAELAPRVHKAVGIDVSRAMIAAARRRCAGLSNVVLAPCSGRDLSAFADESFDLVYAVDSFPYLFAAGATVVAQHFREARRVLRPRGDLVILNFSYRGDSSADRSAVDALSALFGFHVLRNGERPLATWDGSLFHLRRAG